MIETNIFFFILSLSLNYALIYFNNFLKIKSKKQIQDIHINKISRLGGVVIYIIFLIFTFKHNINYFHFILISLIFMIPAFLEDISFSINPKLRLLLIFVSAFLLILFFGEMPKINFYFKNILNDILFLEILIFTIALCALVNGHNVIDGANGLSAFSSLTIFGSLLYIGTINMDHEIVNISSVLIVLIIGFLFFNYPYGKIFLGDGGSYFLGFLSGYLIINSYAKNNDLATISAVLILFYPCFEIVFTFFRRLLQKKSPFRADALHLHTQIFYYFKKKGLSDNKSNFLITPTLSIFWLSPLIFMPICIYSTNYTILVITILIILYIALYIITKRAVSDNNKTCSS